MLYKYIALGIHALCLIAAFVALKYAAKNIKDNHQKAVKAKSDQQQIQRQTNKCSLFAFLIKKYTIINLVTGINSDSMLLLLLSYAIFSITVYFTNLWQICFIQTIALQILTLALQIFNKRRISLKEPNQEETNTIQIKVFLQKSFFYYSIGILAIGGHLIMLVTFYQSQKTQIIKDVLLFIGISIAIDSCLSKPILFFTILQIDQFSELLTTLIPIESKKSNQIANQFMNTNESEAKIVDQYALNIESVFHPAIIVNREQNNFQQSNLPLSVSKKQCRTQSNEIDVHADKKQFRKKDKSRKRIYLENDTKETTDKENLSLKPQITQTSTMMRNLPLERAMKETLSNELQHSTNPHIQSSDTCQSFNNKIGTQRTIQKPTKRQLRRRRKEEQNSKLQSINQRIISIYGEDQDKKFAYETINIKRKSCDRTNSLQWSYNQRNKSTRNRDNPIVHEEPNYVTPKSVQFKLSQQF